MVLISVHTNFASRRPNSLFFYFTFPPLIAKKASTYDEKIKFLIVITTLLCIIKSVDYSSSGLHVISLSIRQWILDSYSFKPCLSRGVPKGYDFQFPFQFFQNFRFPPIIIIDFRFRVDPNLFSYQC